MDDVPGIPPALRDLLDPAGIAVLRDPRSALPEDGEMQARLQELREAVGGLAGLRAELELRPAGGALPLWGAAGPVPVLVLRLDEVTSQAEVRWLPASAVAVAVARRPGPMSPALAHMGVPPGWPGDLPGHLPAYDVRVVELGSPSTALAITTEAGGAAEAVARWHAGATEVLSAGPLPAPPRTATVEVSIAVDDTDPRVRALAASIDLPRLAASLRRGRKGLESKTVVLLSPLDPSSKEVARSDWIVVRATGAKTATLRVDSVIPGNNWHRFDLAPWLWRADTTEAHEPWAAQGRERQEMLRLLDAGDIVGALESAGIELDLRARRLLTGRRLGWSAWPEGDAWPGFARTQLAAAAPWLLAGPAAEFVRANFGKSGDGARVVLLPHQPWQSKVGLSLVPASTPLLAVRSTASNRVLPRVLWDRSALR